MSIENALAIVGLSCRFPGARDVRQYWANLVAGADTIDRFTLDELVAAGVDAELARRHDYVSARGMLAGADRFDWKFFGFSPADAASMDPQQRVFLECASLALDDAAIDPARTGSIGVFAGADYSARGAGETDMSIVLGHDKDFLATRVAYKLDLRGPAITVQTACSTSLVAVHMACRSLLDRECDAALAGGVSIVWTQPRGYLYREGYILSPHGTCRPFDAAAAGTVPSSGVGVVVLRRLSDAIAAGDDIVAVIRGSAINNDGRNKVGYTAPSIPGQREVIQMALAAAAVDAADIGHVEAHGTGTRVGDPIEVAALTAAFRASTDRTGYCALGSVKANLGHTGAAAGVAGLIKSALMLRQGELVPMPHFESPSPELALQSTPFKISTVHRGWESRARLAGVSSFGVGGTNAHVVLEAAPSRAASTSRRRRLHCLSAASSEALDRARAGLADRLEASAPPPEDEVAWTLAAGRRRFRHRTWWLADAHDQTVSALRGPALSATADELPRLGFLFPGQGALTRGTGAAAYELLPEFRRVFDDTCRIARERFDLDLHVMMRPDCDPDWFADTIHQQLGLFALGFSLARQLEAWGITPSAMLGHSIGEFVAAAVAGVWEHADALAIVHHRATAMRALPPGRMLLLRRPVGLDSLGLDDALVIAVDGPDHLVISGPVDRIDAVHEAQRSRGVTCRLLNARGAFHSPAVAPAVAALEAAVAAVPARRPRVPFVSNLSGTWIDADEVVRPDYWGRHLRRPVQLTGGVKTILASGCSAYLELGPGRGLAGALRRHPEWRQEWLAAALLEERAGDERDALLGGLGRLWAHGVELGWEDLFQPDARRRCSLPGHPLEPRTVAPPPVTRVDRRTRSEASGRGDGPSAHHWRWVELPGWTDAPRDILIVDGDERLARAVSGRSGVAAPTIAFPASSAEVAAALDGMAITSAIVIALRAPGSDVLPRLDVVADEAERRRVAVLVVAGGVDRGRETAHALAAWVQERRRTGTVALLDVGDADGFTAVPQLVDDIGQYAWRDGRWWGLERASLELGEAPSNPIIVVSHRDGDGRAEAGLLAAGGSAVVAFDDLSASAPAIEAAGLADGVSWKPPGPTLSQRPDLRARLDALCVARLAEFVIERGRLEPGRRVDVADLRRRLDPHERLPRMIDRFLATLVSHQLLEAGGGLALALARDADRRIADLLGQRDGLDEVAGIRDLIDHVTAGYRAVFSGEQEPSSVLYPDADDSFVRRYQLNNQVAVSDAHVYVDAAVQIVREFVRRAAPSRVRVLEIGAGVGSFTWRLLDGWEDRANLDYLFTDVGPLFVRRARQHAEKAGIGGIDFATFDLTRDLSAQKLAAGTFDLVVACNVVHVAPVVADAVASLARALRPGGMMCLIEPVRIDLWIHVVWGLATGWWNFRDHRTDSLHLGTEAWLDVFRTAGLIAPTAVATPRDDDHVVLLGQSALAPSGADPVDRALARLEDLRREQPTDLLFLPGPDRADTPIAARWPAMLHRSSAGGRTWVVTEDPPADGTIAGELSRRALDPDRGAPSWRHLRVPRLDAACARAVAAALRTPSLPGVVELVPPAGDRAASSPAAATPAASEEAASLEPRPSNGTPRNGAGDAVRAGLAQIWQSTLGLPAADGDDFFELGGDSLLSIQLVTQVRERLGIQVSAAAFTAAPTFAGLLDLVRAQAAGGSNGSAHSAQGVLVLRGTGSRTPIFFGYAVTGTSLCYQALVEAMDPDRPCYGVESPSRDGDAPPLARMEEIAAHHVRAIRAVRPRGPYVLAGWSFGAMVAHEMACQLADAGEAVPLVLCIDGHVVDTASLPLAVRPGYLMGGLWYQAKAAFYAAGLDAPLRGIGRRRRSARADRVPDIGDVARTVTSRTELRRYTAVHNAHLRAMLRYRPRRADSSAVLLQTRVRDLADMDRVRRQVAGLYTGPTEVVRAPGDHWSVLGAHHAHETAKLIDHVLDQRTI